MEYDEIDLRNAFKPIEENPIVLELTGCVSLWRLHTILKEKFGLPEYYGRNWDALWDCLSGLFYGRGAYVVKIEGYRTLPPELREGCVKMLEVFDDVHAETPNVTFEIVS